MVYGRYNYSIHGVYKPSFHHWGAPSCMFQVLLGSDGVHDTWMAAALLRTLRRSLAPTSGRAVLVMPAAYHRPWVTAGMGGFS